MRQEWRKAGGPLLRSGRENSYLSEGTQPDVQSEANTVEKAKVPPKLGKDRQNEEGA